MAIAIKMDRVPIEHEIVLWENSDSTATFAGKKVALSQSANDFDAIRVYWDASTTTHAINSYATFNKSEFEKTEETPGVRFAIGYENSSHQYTRQLSIHGSEVDFAAGERDDGSASNTTNIPTKITGISKKEVVIPSYKNGKEAVTVLWTNSNSGSAMASNTVANLSDGLENYDYVRIVWKSNTGDAIDSESFADWYIGKDPSRWETTTNQERIALSGVATGTTTYVRSVAISKEQLITLDNSIVYSYNKLTFGNGARIANTTTNTSYIIPVAVYGINYIKLTDERVSSTFTVGTTNWSDSTVLFNNETCYYAEYPITYTDGLGPVASITSSSGIITIEEQEAYNKIDYISVDNTNMVLKLYAKTKPTTSFSILAKGVR